MTESGITERAGAGVESALESARRRYAELTHSLSLPETIADPATLRKISTAHAALRPLVDAADRRDAVRERLEAARRLEDDDDPEVAEIAAEEAQEARDELDRLDDEIRVLLLPREPDDGRNVLLEVRAGTGGEEAALFARDVFRMYQRFARAHRLRVDVASRQESGSGGLREIIAVVEGADAYRLLRFESGVHRVQRVPATEASGRVHTSAVTVAVLPEAEDLEVQVDPKDLRVDTFCSSGPGGQSVNTTHSAVRLTHLPTGLVVSCQDEKSQIKNRAKALRVLKSRLLDLARRERQDEIAAKRRGQVGSGDRSEKIRTYNFREGRVTEHRLPLTIHNLPAVLDGGLDLLIESLRRKEQAERLEERALA